MVWQDRRVRQHLRRHYTGPDYCGDSWQVVEYSDPEVRHHLFCVRLCGEGRWGYAWKSEWNYSHRGEYWREANDEGPFFHVLVRGRFAKHEVDRRGTIYIADLENKRRVKDPYYRWSQRALQEEDDHGQMVTSEPTESQ